MKKNILIGFIAVIVLALAIACVSEVDDDNGGVIDSGNGGIKNGQDDDSNGNEDNHEPIVLAEPNFDPMTYTGTGDSIVPIENVGEVAIAHIKGNSGKRHFAVTSYDANQNRLDLLVNTTSAYDGIVLLDAKTAEFEVSGQGNWKIEVRSLVTARVVSVTDDISYADFTGKIDGIGDEVIIVVTKESAPITKITGNRSERHFAVKGYGDSRENLLVNTTDEYTGTVRLPQGSLVILEITATDAWEIEFQ